MNPNLVTVAQGFTVVSALLGAPALAATTLYACFRLKLWLSPAVPDGSFESVKNPDAILLLLGGLTRTLTAVTSVVSSFSQVVFNVVAVVAGVVLMLALALFLTARGLHSHQDWARAVGGVLAVGFLLASLLALLSLRGPLALLALGWVAASVYALIGLWRGFVP